MKPSGWLALLGLTTVSAGVAIHLLQKNKPQPSAATLPGNAVAPVKPAPAIAPSNPAPSIDPGKLITAIGSASKLVESVIPEVGSALGIGAAGASTAIGGATATAATAAPAVGAAVETSLVSAGADTATAAAAGAAASEATTTAVATGATSTEAVGAGVSAGAAIVGITAGLLAPLAITALVVNAIGNEPSPGTNAAAYNAPLYDAGILKRGTGSSNILYDSSGNAQTTPGVQGLAGLGLGRLSGLRGVSVSRIQSMVDRLAVELARKQATLNGYRNVTLGMPLR